MRMRSPTSLFAVTAAAALLIMAPAAASRAEGPQTDLDTAIKQYLATHPDEVRAIVRDYVGNHLDVFRDVLVQLMKTLPAAGPETVAKAPTPTAAPAPPTPNPTAAIKSNAAALFKSTHQVTLGNPNGDVTMVEFFDYNCGFCKGALPAMLSLLSDDPKLRIVLKEWPILGPGSVEAAHVAVAVRMQDPQGQKYLAFHKKLLGDQGQANKEKALAAASSVGFDMTRLQHDMDSPEVQTTIDESFALARALGIGGTPGYVIGETIIPGAVGLAALQDRIASVRHTN